MYVYSRSLSLVLLSLSPFPLSLPLALSLSFCLSISLFSPVVSRCVSADLSRSNFQEVNNLCVSLGVTRCLRLWESVAHALCDTQLHSRRNNHGDYMSHATTRQ